MYRASNLINHFYYALLVTFIIVKLLKHNIHFELNGILNHIYAQISNQTSKGYSFQIKKRILIPLDKVIFRFSTSIPI